MENYRGFELNQPNDTPPWGGRENQLFKDIIDEILDGRPDYATDSLVTTDGAGGWKDSGLNGWVDITGERAVLETSFTNNDLQLGSDGTDRTKNIHLYCQQQIKAKTGYTPDSPNSLVPKNYVDNLPAPATPNFSQVLGSGNSAGGQAIVEVSNLKIGDATNGISYGPASIETYGVEDHFFILNGTDGGNISTAGKGQTTIGTLRDDGLIAGKFMAQKDAPTKIADDTGADTVFVKDGKVGIGTDAPSSELDVNGMLSVSLGAEETRLQFLRDSANGVSRIISRDYLNSVYTDLYLNGTRDNPHIAIKADGKVGIGTDAPMCEFNTNGRIMSTGLGVSPTTGVGCGLAYRTDLGRGALFAYDYTLGGYKDLTINDTAMIIKADGKVGIGTDSPSQQLTVVCDEDILARFMKNGQANYFDIKTNGYVIQGDAWNDVLGSWNLSIGDGEKVLFYDATGNLFEIDNGNLVAERHVTDAGNGKSLANVEFVDGEDWQVLTLEAPFLGNGDVHFRETPTHYEIAGWIDVDAPAQSLVAQLPIKASTVMGTMMLNGMEQLNPPVVYMMDINNTGMLRISTELAGSAKIIISDSIPKSFAVEPV